MMRRLSNTADARRGPRLSAQDLADWAHYARLVRVLPGRVTPVTGTAAIGPAPQPVPAALLPPLARAHAALPPLIVGQAPPGVDGATWRRLQTGKIRHERSLDLHGHTAQRAHAALSAWLHNAAAARLRCVEVITGRGTGPEGGVIRHELPFWLNQPGLRSLLLAAAYQGSHNPGSVKLLLRRARQDK